MKTILSIMGATALLASAASAAPLNPTAVGTPEASNIEQVRVVCDQFGRCWRTGGPRYVYRNYNNGYRKYNSYGAPGYYTFRATVIMAAASALGSVLEADRRWVNTTAN